MTDRLLRIDWLALGIIVAITSFHAWGMQQVPFHPDETSLLYQSADLEAWLHDPLSLAWDPSKAGELDQEYRTLNPPLPKIVLGIGRRLAGFGPEAVAVDWDWSENWDENVAAGALPGDRLLTSARLANVMLLPVSLVLLYMSGLKIGGRAAGIIAVILLGGNSLILLHARRAMAEASVVFGVSLAVFGFLQAREKPWLAGLGAAAAALSKLSAAALAPVGLALVMWPERTGSLKLKHAATRSAAYLGVFIAEILLFDPLLWRHPFRAVEAILEARLEFGAAQISQMGAVLPPLILRTPAARLASLVGNVFLVPPQFAEVGNYVAQTQSQVSVYLAIPGNVMLRGSVAGGAMLLFCILGLTLAAIRFPRASASLRLAVGSLALASGVQAIALYAAVPLPFQRYYVPLIPFVCLWIAYGLLGAAQIAAQARGGLLHGRLGRAD
jgi:4-amino-4-deoxy-L-arabinose transferase-like glycosyltransferase